MFYEQNQFDCLLTCTLCTQRYDIPLMLPCCWKTICKKCTEKMTLNRTCSLCKKQNIQILNSNGKISLPVNEALQKLLDLKPVDLIYTEFYRKFSEFFKLINSNLDELNLIEKHSESNIIQYFQILKSEISKNVENLIQKALNFKNIVLNDLDSLEQTYRTHLKNLNLSNLKKKVKEKLKKYQSDINDSSFNNQDQLLHDCEHLNKSLNDKINFINGNLLNTNKIVFNQKHEMDSLLENFIGKFEYEPNIKTHDLIETVKFLNSFLKMKKIDMDLNLNLIYVRPMGFKKILYVSKNDYDEYTDVSFQICDGNNSVLFEHTEWKSRINYVQTNLKFICVSLTDYRTGRHILKVFNQKLKLIKSIVLESQSNYIFLCEEFIYLKLDNVYPFLHKYNFNLEKESIFAENLNVLTSQSDILVSLNIDKIITIQKNRIYFLDKCFSCVKVYSELNADLIECIKFKEVRDCFIKLVIDFEQDCLDEKIICLNTQKKTLSVYDKNENIIVENKLDSGCKNINEFFLCPDGSLMFLDNLNDAIYYYNV
ncbi:unnamed protein product [Brachionus calyciflorus]|uniref:RING-type domain-containing protein n=1 Tax=Brachionus calyciflorus TaxID=104777 RepID=A0A814GEH0_9BILA|nr:unnamed protein product [Brachionus calyciflorus]